jgi:hypothetical protein
MYKINSEKTLAKAIRNMEAQRVLELEILKKHTEFTLQELNPLNIVKKNIHNSISTIGVTANSFGVKNSLLKTGIGLVTGFLTKKLIVGTNAGLLKRLLGSAVQAAVSGFVIKKLPDQEKTNQF